MHTIGDEYKIKDQALAVCFNTWRESKKKASLTFEAAVHSIKTGDEKNLATFYLMNTTSNRLGWGVTDKALEEALPTLLKQAVTIGCGPGYKTDVHYENPIPVGRWVSTDKPNGYALATAEITDDVAFEKLIRGEWGPISVVIDAYKESKSESGSKIIESFTFHTVDFVDVPAYPQAGFMNFAGLGEKIINPIKLCASFYASQSNGQASGSPGVSLNPKEKKLMSEDIEKLKQKIETLTTNYTELKEEYDELKAGLDKPDEEPTDIEEDPKYKALAAKHKETEDKVKVMEDERHVKHVAAALDARLKAGLVKEKDQKAEKERLDAFDDKTLAMLTLDAGLITEKLEKIEPASPQLKYEVDEEETTPLKAAINARRVSMFGSRSYTATTKETNQ